MASILIIDDSHSALAQIGQWLAAAGHSIQAMVSGKSAVQCARTRAFDVIITDLYMPDCDGLEVIQHLRAHGVKTPVIVVSSNGEQFGLFSLVRKFGALATLAKPFTAEQLLSEVARALALSTTPPETPNTGVHP